MSMDRLKYRKRHNFDSRNLLRVGDLIYFEGPVLTLFMQAGTGYLYLFDWVDRDHTINRWLVYRVTARDLKQYIDGRLSHYDLFKRNPDQETYFVDIDQKNKPFYHYDFYLLDSVPEHYLPLGANYFDIIDCPDVERIRSVIRTSLSYRSMGNIVPHRNMILFSRIGSFSKIIISTGKQGKPERPVIKNYNQFVVKSHFRHKNLSLSNIKNEDRND